MNLKRWQIAWAEKSCRAAFWEWLVTLTMASLPVWFIPLATLFIAGWTHGTDLFQHSIAEGEPLLISTALLGPMTYAIFKDYPADSDDGVTVYKKKFAFPGGGFYLAASGLIAIFSAFVFGALKGPTWPPVEINSLGYFTLSLILFIASNICFILVMWNRNKLDLFSYAKAFRQEEQAFAEQYNREGGAQ
jgi:hypothetical protein